MTANGLKEDSVDGSQANIEGFRYVDDFFKQLLTLSTGSLVLLASLPGSISKGEANPFLAIAAVGSLVACILACLVLKFIYAGEAEWGRFGPLDEGVRRTIAIVALYAGLVAFGAGLIAVGVLAGLALTS